MAALLDKGDLAGAETVYAAQGAYWTVEATAAKPLLDRLAAAVAQDVATDLAAAGAKLDAVRWPAPPAAWPAVRDALAGADAAAEAVRARGILMAEGRAPASYEALVQRAQGVRAAAAAAARSQFAAYDLAATPDFFTAYPVRVEPAAVLPAPKAFAARCVGGVPLETAGKILAAYVPALPEEYKTACAAAYLNAAQAAATPGEPPLKTALATAIALENMGLPQTSLPGAGITVVDITSPTLLHEKKIDFSVSLKKDLPLDVAPAKLHEVFARMDKAREGVFILVDVAVARANREVKKMETVSSQRKTGTTQAVNEEYNKLKAEVDLLSLELQTTQLQPATLSFDAVSLLLGPEYAKAAKVEEAQKKLVEAVKKLQGVNQYETVGTYAEYPVRKATLKCAKSATVHFYIADMKAKTMFADTFDTKQAETFHVYYGLDPADPDLDRLRAESDTDEDVTAFEEGSVQVSLKDMLAYYVERYADAQPMKKVAALREKVSANRNEVMESYKNRTYEADTKDDPRFNSVVVVNNPDGSMGSGFFVTDDIVLTNYHVIENATYIELRLFNKNETFGKVIAQDARLDLALVQVQTRGTPVCFYKELKIPLGKSVDAIGHPQGYVYSISHGVISAFRSLESRFAPGGHKVMFIQTDTAINPGNSGGPLFMGDQVVGVNTWKLITEHTEAMNFCVHYAEVIEFLKKNGITARTGS
ncbi:MAG: S1C family serine protease [Desulfovibrionaceae bacterium]